MVDAGLFVPYCNITVYARSHCQFMQQAVDWWNVTGLPTECLAGEPEAWHCLFPGYLLNYIKTPLFMVAPRPPRVLIDALLLRMRPDSIATALWQLVIMTGGPCCLKWAKGSR